MAISVIVVDDQVLFLRGLELIFHDQHPDVNVVGITTDAYNVCSLIDELNPDVVLIDLLMSPVGGPALIEQVAHDVPGVRLVAFSGTDDLNLILEAMQSGASCFLPKEKEPEEYIVPLRLVVQGWSIVPQVVIRHLLHSSYPVQMEGQKLTTEQFDIWCMVTHGWTDDDISHNLACADRTAKRHIRDTIHVLGAKSRVHAAALGGQAGLLMSDPMRTLVGTN